jgi:hypothetical protein
VWATRLGSHLFSRINKDKKDARSACTRDTTLCRTNSPQTAHQHSYRHASLPCPLLCRFDMMRDSGAKLLLPWMTQGLWAFALSLPVTLTNALFAADQSTSTVASAVVGSSYSAAAEQLTLREVLAGLSGREPSPSRLSQTDRNRNSQRMRRTKGNSSTRDSGDFQTSQLYYSKSTNNIAFCLFVNTALTCHNLMVSVTLWCCWCQIWAMTMWFGLYLSCSSVFTAGSHYLSIAGPCFNAFLLLFVSGIPLLEKSSDKKLGKQSATSSTNNGHPC